jgi:GNAT superfamily N-acetyltransferase
MTPHEPLKMLWSYSEGWADVVRMHPTVSRTFLLYVVPMSIVPAAMIFYAGITNHELLTPSVTAREALLVAITFFLVELAMVPLMAAIIQQMGELVDIRPDYHDAFMLAAHRADAIVAGIAGAVRAERGRRRGGDGTGVGCERCADLPRHAAIVRPCRTPQIASDVALRHRCRRDGVGSADGRPGGAAEHYRRLSLSEVSRWRPAVSHDDVAPAF